MTEPFLKRGDPQGTVNTFMVERYPFPEGLVKSIKGVSRWFWPIKEPVPDKSKKPFHLSATPWFSRRSVDQVDTEIGTNKFKMLAGITRTVISVKSERFAMGSN